MQYHGQQKIIVPQSETRGTMGDMLPESTECRVAKTDTGSVNNYVG